MAQAVWLALMVGTQVAAELLAKPPSTKRRSRYRSQAKTHLQHLASAAALNLFRILDWLNAVPFAPTRHSPLSHLVA